MDDTMETKHTDMSAYLISHFTEEIDGAKDYFDLAKESYHQGKGEMAKYLMMMTEDECSHAEFIMKVAPMHNTVLPEKEVERFEMLKMHIKKFL